MEILNKKQMIHEEQQYLDLLREVLDHGELRLSERTGVGTKALFGRQHRYSLRNESFPLFTTKKVSFSLVLSELLWMLSGDTRVKTLQDQGNHIWDGNTTRSFLDAQGMTDFETGLLGKGYGYQWRHCGRHYDKQTGEVSGPGVDQLADVLEQLKSNPESRRHLVVSWNPLHLKEMALAPCHCFFQFFVAKEELSCLFYQRSCDLGLGVPFNVASYALLTIIMAHLTGLKPGELIHSMGDVHIYLSHEESLRKQIERSPYPFPRLRITNASWIRLEDVRAEEIQLLGYKSHSKLKMSMAV